MFSRIREKAQTFFSDSRRSAATKLIPFDYRIREFIAEIGQAQCWNRATAGKRVKLVADSHRPIPRTSRTKKETQRIDYVVVSASTTEGPTAPLSVTSFCHRSPHPPRPGLILAFRHRQSTVVPVRSMKPIACAVGGAGGTRLARLPEQQRAMRDKKRWDFFSNP